MEDGGPLEFGSPSDEPDGADGPEGPDGLDGPTTPQRGWIAPDDRLWRHPSEMSGSRSRSMGYSGAGSFGKGSWGSARNATAGTPRHRPLLVAGVAALAMTATVAAGFVLAEAPAPSSQSTFVATNTSVSTPIAAATDVSHADESHLPPEIPAVPAGAEVMRLASDVRPSLVELVLHHGKDPLLATAISLPGGNLVVTASTVLQGVSSVSALTSTGRKTRASIVATDPHSGVGVVALTASAPAARIAGNDLAPGQLAVAVCLRAEPHSARETGRAPTPVVSVGVVRSVGVSPSSNGGPPLIDAIESDAPLPGCAYGGVLLDRSGAVAGVLAWQDVRGDDTVDVFTPATLAVGAAEELASFHRVVHGWLGVVGEDVPGAPGALVVKVLPGSAGAAAGLEPGDVVETIDSHRVISISDLQARLYVLRPGTQVTLGVERSGVLRTVTLALGSQPG